VFNNPVRSSNVWQSFIQRIEKPVTGLLFTLGLAAIALPSFSASSVETPANLVATPTASQISQVATVQPLADGVYLYGQSPERDQINSAYLVFEVTQGQIVGAFYMPRSSFDCVYGDMKADQLALNVVDSYSREAYPYAVALQPTDSVAEIGAGSAPPVTLEGMHRIDNINSNDQRILSTCKADHQPRS
jgi:hypothetical protein